MKSPRYNWFPRIFSARWGWVESFDSTMSAVTSWRYSESWQMRRARLFPLLSPANCQHNNIFRITQQTSTLWTSESDIAMATRLSLLAFSLRSIRPKAKGDGRNLFFKWPQYFTSKNSCATNFPHIKQWRCLPLYPTPCNLSHTPAAHSVRASRRGWAYRP